MAIRLKAEERRRRLMRAARRLFTEKGYEGATMEEIARAAECSTGPLYHLFRTKREIFEAVLRQSLDLLHKQFRVEHRRADRSALERLELACDHLIDLLAFPETTMFAREAPQVLGADVWRRMRDDLMLRGFEADLRDAMTSGEIDAEPQGLWRASSGRRLLRRSIKPATVRLARWRATGLRCVD